MIQKTTTEIFKDLGLNEKEIKVYLALLPLGDATVNQIALTSKIKRTSLYLILEKLRTRGLVGEYKTKYGSKYASISPRKLISKLDSIKSELEVSLPELESLEKKDFYSPNVKYYKGRAGYITIFQESLESYNHEILYIGSANLQNEILGEKYITKTYLPERLKRKITIKQLMVSDGFAKKLSLSADSEQREIKFLPNYLEISSNLLIYNDKVAFFTSDKELSCVVIQSQDIANTEREKFNLLWGKI